MSSDESRLRRRAVGWVAVAVTLIMGAFAVGVQVGDEPGRAQGEASRPVGGGPPQRSFTSAEDEAVAGALHALRSLTSREFVADAAARARIIAEIATREDMLPQATQGASAQPNGAADPMAAALAPEAVSLWRLVPVGIETTACSKVDCTVRVWSVQLSASTGEPVSPARATWATTTLPMRWSPADGWRVRLTQLTTEPGPVPAAQPGAATASDLDVVAAGREYRPLQLDAATPGVSR